MVVEKRKEFKEFEEYKDREPGRASHGACLACEAVVSNGTCFGTSFRCLRSVMRRSR
jgi:hypothetical protein